MSIASILRKMPSRAVPLLRYAIVGAALGMLCLPAWAMGPSVTITKRAGDTLLTCTINISTVMVSGHRRANATGTVSCAVPKGYPGDGSTVRIEPVIRFVDIYRGGIQIFGTGIPDASQFSLNSPQFTHTSIRVPSACIKGQRYYWRAELDVAFYARLDYNGSKPFFSVYDMKGEETDWTALSADCGP